MAKQRRPNGCMLNLGNDRWRPVVTVGYITDPATGRKRQKQKWFPIFEGGKTAARKHLEMLTAEVDAGETVLPSRQTVAEYMTKWIEEDIAPPATAANTYRSFRYAVQTHIVPALGHIALQDLSRAHVKAFLREREKALVKRRKTPHLLKKASVRLIRDVLHSALADA